ncbi:GYD domain-containing protein [Thiohalomonas denitrificans]|uniref:GYD domain-containing protein n=1 Tax=Thiohalomonas denitrificans TaxID=415747 RepID=UPI0026EA5E1F|nr:GYD domain-containing protein [Thiohalomonas denitrificans]
MKSRLLMLMFLSLFYMSPISTYAGPEPAEQEGATMHIYLIFFGFTAQGIQDIKESPARVEAAKETVRTMGGEMKAFYGILGSEFDTIFILEAPDDEAVAKMVLAIASGGNVRTETHRLFTEDEYKKVISSLP